MIQSWKLGLASLVMSGAIAFWANGAYAQITPDTTLGSEISTVTSTGEVDSINGGATRGTNLFHSFGEFNVDEGRTTVFTNPSGIENILTRVTGANPSNIFGTLAVAGGNANLFLINPNGIIFGSNARLDVGGSFVGTTANAIGFGNQGFFSATNPSNPELLTVNPSALLFNQIRAASLENNSVASSGLNPSSEFTATGLRVPNGNSLLLVGGDINMYGGGLFAFGGRVEIGGLAGTGTVGLNGDGNNLSLSFPNSVERSNVFLSNGAGVAVTADDGGSITINARNLEMAGESGLIAGIANGLGSDNSKAGNIEVNATGVINLNNGSEISNAVITGASGQGGDVIISASTLQVEGGAQVEAATFGNGKGGNLTIDVRDVQLIGSIANPEFPSGLFTSSGSNSIGDTGDLTIKTNTLLIKDGAQVNAGTRGVGKGGNLTVDTQDVQLIGTSVDPQVPSALFANAEPNSTGDAGDLTIKTNRLLVRDGAVVGTATFGTSKGGNLTIEAQDVQLIGTSVDGRTRGLATSAQPNSTGDAGDLTIRTNTLLVRDGAALGTATFSAGKGGNLTVDAQDVQIIGESADGQFASELNTSTQPKSTGNAGDLTIKTNTLLVKDGAQVNAGTSGAGKGGSLTVDAIDVQLIGKSAADDRFASVLGTSAQPNSTGDAGDLTIKTNTLLVRDGAEVSTGTFSSGKGGDLKVDAIDVQIIGTSVISQFFSGLFASTQPNSTGDAGDLTIKTDTLLVQDGAAVTVQSSGKGTAGNMTIDARSIRLNNNALLSANTQSALVDPNTEQATININSQNLIVRRGSNIRTNATGENVIGGNININSDIILALENSDISANSVNFRGGNVRINAQAIFGTQFRDVASDRTSDITATGASPEFSGTVELNTLDTDLNSGLVNLPTVPVDTEVAQACTPGGTQSKSEFVVTGRGGLPPSPDETLSTDSIQVDWVTLNPKVENRNQGVSTNITTPEPDSIVEATGWALDRKGDVILTASAAPVLPGNSWQTPAKCHTK